MITEGPDIRIEAPWPFDRVIPVAPMVIIAPVGVRICTCSAGRSDSVSVTPVVVCRCTFGVTGVAPASAVGG